LHALQGDGWKLVPRGDGAAGRVAVACDCGMEKRASLVMDRAKIPKRYEHCDFESYVTDLTDGKTWMPQHAHSLKQAKLFTQGFVREYPGSSEKGLLFMGPSGVGKTHLAVAALKELIHRGHAGLFCDYRELLKEIQASYNPASESTEMKILEPIRTVEILVLDDLGASKPSDWVRDIVGIVLNARYNENRTTIITTNYLDKPYHRRRCDTASERQIDCPDARRCARAAHWLAYALETVRDVPHRGSFRSRFSAGKDAGRTRASLIRWKRALLSSKNGIANSVTAIGNTKWGVKIGTLDNPGWMIAISLNETRAEHRILQKVRIERTEDDWINYWVEKKHFRLRAAR